MSQEELDELALEKRRETHIRQAMAEIEYALEQKALELAKNKLDEPVPIHVLADDAVRSPEPEQRALAVRIKTLDFPQLSSPSPVGLVDHSVEEV